MKNKPLKGKCLKSESRKLSAFLPINFVLSKKMVNKSPGEEVLHAMLHSCLSFLNVDDYHKWRMVNTRIN